MWRLLLFLFWGKKCSSVVSRLFFFPHPKHFWFYFPRSFLWKCVELFFKILVKWSKFQWRKRSYCCVLSDFLILPWFCTQQLPHHLCLCILLISREHHSVASILLPAFSSLPHSLWHPHLFFHCFCFICDAHPPTSGPMVFRLVPSGLLNTSTYLLTLIYFCFFSHVCVKSCYCCHCSLCNLTFSPPQICQVRRNLTNQVALTDKEPACASEWSPAFIFWVSVSDTEKLTQLWFCWTSLLKAFCNLCLSNSDVQQKAEKTR